MSGASVEDVAGLLHLLRFTAHAQVQFAVHVRQHLIADQFTGVAQRCHIIRVGDKLAEQQVGHDQEQGHGNAKHSGRARWSHRGQLRAPVHLPLNTQHSTSHYLAVGRSHSEATLGPNASNTDTR